jgi:hypothetical protein
VLQLGEPALGREREIGDLLAGGDPYRSVLQIPRRKAIADETDELVVGELEAVGGRRDGMVAVRERIVTPHHDRPNRPNRPNRPSPDRSTFSLGEAEVGRAIVEFAPWGDWF